MTSTRASVRGILRKGFGVASGFSNDYPHGSLERQLPIFKARELDLEGLYLGTLNVDIGPCAFKLIDPEFTFRDVRWTDLHPPEHFSFSRCSVVHKGVAHVAWIYLPHPETKQRHFHDPSLMEIVAPPIAGVQFGDLMEVRVDPARVALTCPDQD